MKKAVLPILFFFFATGLMVSQAQQKAQPQDTEVWEPEPIVVSPGENNLPPSDAIVLFDGSGFGNWESAKGEPVKWNIEGNAMVVKGGTGSIQTKQEFSDFQLHIEWRTPAEVKDEGQGRGNSGVFLQGRYELQILDSYNNRTYSNGQAGSIYKQSIPLVNASLPPGEWQRYDIIYTAPHFAENDSLLSPAYVTVLHNGILVQNHYEIKGLTLYIGKAHYEAHGDAPIVLQDHGNPTAFRNIWVREL